MIYIDIHMYIFIQPCQNPQCLILESLKWPTVLPCVLSTTLLHSARNELLGASPLLDVHPG